jgi:hypothetical protein
MFRGQLKDCLHCYISPCSSFGGLVIFLFNNDHEVFSYVTWWIGLFSVMYGLVTLLPFIRHDSPYNSPLSTLAWFLYTGMSYVTFQGFIFMIAGRHPTLERHLTSQDCHPHYYDLRDRYCDWMFGGVEKAAEETASKRSSEIDIRILDWTVSTLGDDDSLRNFVESIPGFFSSKMLEHLKGDIPRTLREKFVGLLHEFWERTWTSKLISDSEKARRLDISLKAMNQTHEKGVWSILFDILVCNMKEVPLTVEMGHTIARWCTSIDQGTTDCARSLVAIILVIFKNSDDSWIRLATRAFGPLERDVQDSIAQGGDSVLLAILIRVTRQSIPTGPRPPLFLGSQYTLPPLGLLDIHNTLPRLQHDFCALWNELVKEARIQRPHSILVYILRLIRRPYIALHQATDAAPIAFSASTPSHDRIFEDPLSYPLCNLATHRPGSNAHLHLPTQTRDPPMPTNKISLHVCSGICHLTLQQPAILEIPLSVSIRLHWLIQFISAHVQ